MKAKSQTFQGDLPAWGARFPDYLALIKFRLLTLVLLATSMGFYLGAAGSPGLQSFLGVLLGIGFVGGGANALNQWYEREADTLMKRTRNRPLPAGRLSGSHALTAGLILSLLGFLVLTLLANNLTLALAFLSWASYLFLYTPLKSRSVINTWIGAIPGALPVLLGFTAAAGELEREAFALLADSLMI